MIEPSKAQEEDNIPTSEAELKAELEAERSLLELEARAERDGRAHWVWGAKRVHIAHVLAGSFRYRLLTEDNPLIGNYLTRPEVLELIRECHESRQGPTERGMHVEP